TPAIAARSRLRTDRSAWVLYAARAMELLNPASPEEALEAALRAVRFRSTLLCRSELSAPWGFGVRGRDFATFHIALRGGGVVEVEGVEGQLRLATGDMVVLPHGDSHAVRDSPSSAVTRLEQLIADCPLDAHGVLRNAGRGAETVLVCGGFQFE